MPTTHNPQPTPVNPVMIFQSRCDLARKEAGALRERGEICAGTVLVRRRGGGIVALESHQPGPSASDQVCGVAIGGAEPKRRPGTVEVRESGASVFVPMIPRDSGRADVGTATCRAWAARVHALRVLRQREQGPDSIVPQEWAALREIVGVLKNTAVELLEDIPSGEQPSFTPLLLIAGYRELEDRPPDDHALDEATNLLSSMPELSPRIGKGVSPEQAKVKAERIVQRYGYRGFNWLHDRVGCSKATLIKAIGGSPCLTARKAEHEHEGKPTRKSVRATGSIDEAQVRARSLSPSAEAQARAEEVTKSLIEEADPRDLAQLRAMPRDTLSELAELVKSDPAKARSLGRAATRDWSRAPKPRNSP